jgi:hypothetical protein
MSDVVTFTPGVSPGGFLQSVTSADPIASGLGSAQGDVAMRSDIARATYGVDGTGVKIGVLSNSFDAQGGMASDIANGYLPADTTILKDMTGAAATDEGRAIAQLAHDIAPGSSIAFHTANVSQDDLAAGILALFDAGCRVIVDDVTYYAEPFFQSNAICQAIDSVVSQGAVFLTSAGNDANNSYQSDFRPVSATMPDGQAMTNVHDFDPGAGVSTVQSVTIAANTTVNFVLQWDQAYGAAATNMAMSFYAGGALLGTVDRDQSVSTLDPIVGARITTGASPVTLQVAIDDVSGPLPGLLKYVAYANGAPVSIDTFSSPAGTVTGHHMDPSALTVGAASYAQTAAFGVSPPVLESFSSSGDAEFLFDGAGNRLFEPEHLGKIDLVAADGISTSVPGLTSFFGTSASVSSAAGVAALMLDANGSLTASDVGNLMKSSAVDMGAAGYDVATGYGFIQADQAVAFASTLTITGTDGADTLFGTHLDDTFDGGRGNDTLIGAGGRDTFIVGAGQGSDTIQDFGAGAGGDIVKFAGYDIDYAYVQSHLGAMLRNAGTILTLPGGDTLALAGVTAGTLTADNFLFDGSGGTPAPGGEPGGPDTLVLHLSEDAWNGDAQFTLDVDGVQIAGPTAVTTARSSGGFQDFTYHGSFGPGPHAVAVHFINDGWGGSAATDRNLYVGAIDFNGLRYDWTAAANDAANGSSDAGAAVMAINGTVAFHDIGVTPTDEPPSTATGPDTLVLHLSEDAWNGDAQFTLDVDGNRIAGPTAVTTAHGSGFQEFTYRGSFGDGPHTVAVHFINDGWGGTAATDRNLYVGGIEFNGTHYAGQTAQNDALNGQADSDPGAAEMLVNGTVTFSAVGPSAPPPPPAGSDTLVLHLSEDAWNGDAQFTLDVDGTRIAGPTAVTTSHGSNGLQDFAFERDFGAGPHTVAIHFINDAWGGSADADRNLYVGGIDFNGTHYAGQTAQNDAHNWQPDSDPNAAEMLINGTVTFAGINGSSGASGFLI